MVGLIHLPDSTAATLEARCPETKAYELNLAMTACNGSELEARSLMMIAKKREVPLSVVLDEMRTATARASTTVVLRLAEFTGLYSTTIKLSSVAAGFSKMLDSSLQMKRIEYHSSFRPTVSLFHSTSLASDVWLSKQMWPHVVRAVPLLEACEAGAIAYATAALDGAIEG